MTTPAMTQMGMILGTAGEVTLAPAALTPKRCEGATGGAAHLDEVTA